MTTTRARRAIWPAALFGALGLTVAGCSSSGGAAAPLVSGTISGFGIGGQNLVPSAAPGQCFAVTDLDNLSSVTTWLRQMIGDEVIFGTGAKEVKRDGQMIIGYAQSLGSFGATLPASYARELRTSVLPVAASPYKKTPNQLNLAANAAEKLNDQLNALC